MDEKELADLEDESTWDWERAEGQAPIGRRRSVLAVPFERDELDLIRHQAEQAGVTVIEYVRRCVLKAAAR